MNAKTKMLNQEFYLSADNDLLQEREAVKDLLFELNNTQPSKRDHRHALLRQLLGALGEDPWIESPFSCDYGYNIAIGNNFYANNHCTILDCAQVTIGNNVLFGPNVSLYTPNHPMDANERREGYERALPISIGNDVWVGGSVTILPGVTIGHNTVIGAGSVVTKSIPANVVAVGVPCRVLRRITEHDKIGLSLSDAG